MTMQQGKLRMFIAAFAMVGSGLLLAPSSAQAVPSFARQTGFACEACHTVFPELTPFGRRFKLNAYTIDNLPQVSGITANREQTLALNQLPPLSFMLQMSYTSTKAALPDPAVTGALAKNGQVLVPQQASLFYAGKIAPNFGAFVQMTYDGVDDAFGWDNTDVRYAQTANDKLLWGISFNNNPTVQDPWNTTPAWQSPFDQRSSVAPSPGAATMLDGSQFDMSTAGLSVYAYFNNSVYAEFGMYHQANHGFGQIDSTVDQPVLNGLAPYWRLAYERQWDRKSWEVGAYGMEAKVYPADGSFALTGPTDKYSDWAIDSQYQYIGDDHLLTLTGTYISEKQTLDASTVLSGTNASNDLKTLRLNVSYYYHRKYGAALGYFSTTGSEDAALYAPNPVDGYANNKPDSKGWVAELDWVPYENTKFALQYTMYNKFNGASDNYDGAGRNAKDNNTLYLLSWINF
jgi:hypothetical protein